MNIQRYFWAFVMFLCSTIANAWTTSDYVYDFEWLEPNNRIEIAVGESHQLQFNCSTNKDKPFTSEYSTCWVHYDFSPSQHVVDSPSGYSINEKGVITGLVPGSYAIKFTSIIQPKSGADKWLYITVVKEKKETESNNTLATANEFTTKIRCGLYNSSDVDYVKVKHNMKVGTYFKFKVHYEGYRTSPFGYKWATFSGTSPELVGSGSLINQDQECRGLVTGGNYIYFELYYDQSQSSYFNSGEEFVIELMNESDVKVQEITLNYSSKSLNVDESFGLSATVSPSNATNKSLVWSSSNSSVASVTSDGLVTAKSKGNATITAKANDGSNVSASCSVTVTEKIVEPSASNAKIRLWKNGTYQEFDTNDVDSITFVEVEADAHEYVDLGLPSGTLWATCNIGAEKPEDYGDYFAWGETTGYKSGKMYFDWSTYKWCNGSSSTMTKYCISSKYGTVDNKTVLKPEDDAAHVNWGGSWRMPTLAEQAELRNNCTWTWTTHNGVNGYKVTSKSNSNSIFLPAAGYRGDDNLNDAGSFGSYQSSSLDTSSSSGAYCLNFSSIYYVDWRSCTRYYGTSVRPVCQ